MEVGFKAVAHWLDVLESFYYHFRIYPFVSKNIRSLKKEPKAYLWGILARGKGRGPRFENMIASHLLKLAHFLYDYEGFRTGLYFLRDLTKKEVDFLVTVDNRPWFAVQVKLQETETSPSLLMFKDKWKIPWCYQVVKKPGIDQLSSGVRVVSADRFLLGLA